VKRNLADDDGDGETKEERAFHDVFLFLAPCQFLPSKRASAKGSSPNSSRV